MDELPTVTIDGHQYGLRITYSDIIRVREMTGLDLFIIAETGDFGSVNKSIENVVNVVFWLLNKQLLNVYNDIKVAKDAFEDSLDGETLEQVVNVWQVAMVNFIPSLAVREAARDELTKRTQAEALATIQMIIDSAGLGANAKPSDTPELSESNP